jgi:uncharacterized protein YyaL (SSP411 family)
MLTTGIPLGDQEIEEKTPAQTIMAKKHPHPSGVKNHLAGEQSPYLIQHADNPVDWYPWGDEAFAIARDEDKPIFLSIGYSTCHWCHVMAHESFEDPVVAALMNETFVNIKVDREERPEIDNIYMAVCQMLTGSGGWPLTIIMTPDKKPFFAGTYFPRENSFGRIGMIDLVPKIAELWESKRQDAVASAEQITEALRNSTNPPSASQTDSLSVAILDQAFQQLNRNFDEIHGGFGTAPKFPTPHNLLFLLRIWKGSDNDRALQMVTKTLDKMRLGGIYDQVGFGFHRYSTDAEWLLPHFEKMLYDQALLAMAYTEAFLATGRDDYEDTAREIFTYIMRDLTSPEGGFYSAEDADSEGEEGKFYLWTEEEIRRILNRSDADKFIHGYSVSGDGNFTHEAGGKTGTDNILHHPKPKSELARELGMAVDDLEDLIDRCRTQLFEEREKRVHPHKDDKILTDWNGLMIAALAGAGKAFDEPAYTESAARAANFLLGHLRREDGRLLHRYRQGDAAIDANLDDYAFLIWGLIELYEATFDVTWLQAALDLSHDQVEHFWDDQKGGFFFTGDDAEALLVRTKEIYDGAVPSGNSAAAHNLLRLARITADTDLENRAHATINAFKPKVERMPSAHSHLMSALDFGMGESQEIVIVGDFYSEDTRAMFRAVQRRYLPNTVVVHRPAEAEGAMIILLAPYTENQLSLGGKATAYVCRNYNCKLPTTDVQELLRLLQ